MTFDLDNVQAAELGYAWPKTNVGAPSSHIRGNSHGAAIAGPGDDLSFLLVLLAVQQVKGNARRLQPLCQQFAVLDRSQADEDGPARTVDFIHFLGDGSPFRLGIAKEACGEGLAPAGLAKGDAYYLEAGRPPGTPARSQRRFPSCHKSPCRAESNGCRETLAAELSSSIGSRPSLVSTA